MGAEIKEIPYKKGPKAGQMAPPRLFLSKGAKIPSDTAYRLTYKTARLVLNNIANIEKFMGYCEGKEPANVTVQVAADSTKEATPKQLQRLLNKI
jgi:hypothetical protein